MLSCAYVQSLFTVCKADFGVYCGKRKSVWLIYSWRIRFQNVMLKKLRTKKSYCSVKVLFLSPGFFLSPLKQCLHQSESSLMHRMNNQVTCYLICLGVSRPPAVTWVRPYVNYSTFWEFLQDIRSLLTLGVHLTLCLFPGNVRNNI